ncbi:hypothetical protein [Acetobacter indonesiensis]|uniref:Uncharacterized protein n=1 Tax=Acetobacter indonesiensis TaxID=104101 RepID=A0A252ANS0_9PROT|nr:hypothetical protein [Acetobacter indonesiensis]OUI91407.1 hypothetical protein HK17_11725 [Acetobacter indonesiensis]
MSARDTVIKKLFAIEGEILDVKFFPGNGAVGAADLIWTEFGKALSQLESGHAEVSARWEGKTAARNLATFIAAQ